MKQWTNSFQNASILFFLTSVAILLRFLYLGNPFLSADYAELAIKILKNPGYLWMAGERVGFLINFFVKLFVGSVSFLGIKVTEFWWKAPIALFGTAQVPLTYFFLKGLGCKRTGALTAAAFVSILPIHVMQSRYLWGHEVLGVFFVTTAIWALIQFFRHPAGFGLIASLFTGLYLISHGYILPFIVPLVAIIFLFGPPDNQNIKYRFIQCSRLIINKLLWLFPIALFPFYLVPLQHTFSKKTHLGFYWFYIFTFIRMAGIFLFVYFIISAFYFFIARSPRRKSAALFFICAISYLAPLFFGTPKGITVVPGYMLMGTYFLVLVVAIFFDEAIESGKRSVSLLLIIICFILTLWGDIETIFFHDKLYDLSEIRGDRGAIIDPGTKAAGYLVRKYVPNSAELLAIHRCIDPPILFYYFGRDRYNWQFQTLEDGRKNFIKYCDLADMVICEDVQRPMVEGTGSFVLKAIINHSGYVNIYPTFSDTPMFIYARPYINMPGIQTDRAYLNRCFDKEYSWKVSLR